MDKKEMTMTDAATVGEFSITTYEKELEYEFWEKIKGVYEGDEGLKEHCMVLRVEHETGVFAVEYPVYTEMFHNIMSLMDDAEALKGLLTMIMESAMTIGDREYVQKRREILAEYIKRTEGSQDLTAEL